MIFDFRFGHERLREYVEPEGERPAVYQWREFVYLEVDDRRSSSYGSSPDWRRARVTDLIDLLESMRTRFGPSEDLAELGKLIRATHVPPVSTDAGDDSATDYIRKHGMAMPQ